MVMFQTILLHHPVNACHSYVHHHSLYVMLHYCVRSMVTLHSGATQFPSSSLYILLYIYPVIVCNIVTCTFLHNHYYRPRELTYILLTPGFIKTSPNTENCKPLITLRLHNQTHLNNTLHPSLSLAPFAARLFYCNNLIIVLVEVDHCTLTTV